MWRAKYRMPDGRQVQRTIGPAWTARSRPPRGFYTRRTAEAWLRDILEQARLGTLSGMVRTGQTFAMVAEEYLAYLAHAGSASHQPCATRARSYGIICCPPSARMPSKTSRSMTSNVGRAS